MARKWKPVVLSTVDDLIAEDWWEIRHRGRRLLAHIAIGRAAPDPSGRDWYCPVLMEGLPEGWAEMKRWKPIYGVGSIDSTMNAFVLVSRAFHEFGPAIVAQPKAKARRARSKK